MRGKWNKTWYTWTLNRTKPETWNFFQDSFAFCFIFYNKQSGKWNTLHFISRNFASGKWKNAGNERSLVPLWAVIDVCLHVHLTWPHSLFPNKLLHPINQHRQCVSKCHICLTAMFHSNWLDLIASGAPRVVNFPPLPPQYRYNITLITSSLLSLPLSPLSWLRQLSTRTVVARHEYFIIIGNCKKVSNTCKNAQRACHLNRI